MNRGGVHLGVADPTNTLDGFELLGGEADQTGLKTTGDAAARHRALQAILEKRIIQPVATGTEALESPGRSGDESQFTRQRQKTEPVGDFPSQIGKGVRTVLHGFVVGADGSVCRLEVEDGFAPFHG